LKGKRSIKAGRQWIVRYADSRLDFTTGGLVLRRLEFPW
jgi:hypothetical protein